MQAMPFSCVVNLEETYILFFFVRENKNQKSW
jgi:hypothetical protein